jgi:site-specific DNA recombinase
LQKDAAGKQAIYTICFTVPSPKVVAPRQLSSPTLLTGLLKCSCGASMTLATGKGGKYNYYKCTQRINISKDACLRRNLSMEKLDGLVLNVLANEVFTPIRVQSIIKECQKGLRKSVKGEKEQIKKLRRNQEECSRAINNSHKVHWSRPDS